MSTLIRQIAPLQKAYLTALHLRRPLAALYKGRRITQPASIAPSLPSPISHSSMSALCRSFGTMNIVPSAPKKPLNRTKIAVCAAVALAGAVGGYMTYNTDSPTFRAHLLCTVPFSIWPQKATALISLFRTIENKQKLAEALANAICDKKTKQIGINFTAALQATTLQESIPYFQEIQALLPQMTEIDYSTIFNRPFPPLLKKKSISVSKDAPLIAELNFNPNTLVIAHQSLLIGTYDGHLLCYDKNTQKMVWGQKIPHVYVDEKTPYLISYQMSPLGIVLLTAHDKNVTVLDPNTGKTKVTFILPIMPTNRSECILITPDGFCYFLSYADGNTNRTLYGASIRDGKWDQQFAIKAPKGKFSSLGELSFFYGVPIYHFQVIVDGTGKQHRIDSRIELRLGNKALYIKDGSTLAVWENAALKSMNLPNGSRMRLKAVGKDGTCFLEEYSSGGLKSFIFADIDSQRCMVAPHQTRSDAEVHFDPQTNTIWSYDDQTGEIWKQTKTECIKIGTIDNKKHGDTTTTLHADGDTMYFIRKHR